MYLLPACLILLALMIHEASRRLYASTRGTAKRRLPSSGVSHVSIEAGAISKDGRNVGIAQTNVVHAWRYEAHGWSFWPDALDARKNLQIAYELYLEAGWRPWSCRP